MTSDRVTRNKGGDVTRDSHAFGGVTFAVSHGTPSRPVPTRPVPSRPGLQSKSPPLPRTPQRGVLAIESVVTSLLGCEDVPDQLRNPSTRGRGNAVSGVGLITDQRHERIRGGQRKPIPAHVRVAVWFRDRGLCELCGFQPIEGPWHLDHVIPWSAGGPDSTDNLRVLCEAHNMARSNFVDLTERPRRPATWWCLNCFAEPDPEWMDRHDDDLDRMPGEWRWSESGVPVCPAHRYGCSVTRGCERTVEQGEAATWHRRALINPTEAGVVAYCAHCHAPGLTDRPL